MVDGRRGRWIAYDAAFFDGPFGIMLFERFGPAGVTLFLAFLCACKRNLVQGQIEYGSAQDALALMGIPTLELVDASGKAWELQSFWRALAAHKQCSTSRRGRLTQVRSSNWAKWQEGFVSQTAAKRKSRSKGINTPEDTPLIDSGSTAEKVLARGETETETETETERVVSAAKPPPKRATGPPDSFPLDDDLRAWAGTHIPAICDERRLLAETERFLDHHRAKGSTFRDWRAAWRTWMGRAAEYAPRAVAANGRPLTTVERSLRTIQEGYDQRGDREGSGRDGHVLAPARAIEAGT